MKIGEGINNYNKYGSQIEDKFDDLVIHSPVTFIEISYKDLSSETIHHINEYIKDCTTKEERYLRLNGIMPDVIARIANQVKHRILAKRLKEDPVIINTTFNSIRELASNHWWFIN